MGKRCWCAGRFRLALAVGRSKSSEDGQELVEYAFVFPLLFLLLFGVIEVGIVAFSYNTIANGAREGARYGIVNYDEYHWDEVAANIEATVRSGLYTTMISETATVSSAVIDGSLIRVEVTYPVTLTTIAFAKALPSAWEVTRPIAENMTVGPTIHLKAVSMMPIE